MQMELLNNINETGNRRLAGEQASRAGRRSQAKLWVAVGIAIAVVATAWLAYSYRQSDAAASAPAALPQVVVSKPLEREVDSRLGFLGQFSAVEQVELRAQVGGTLTGIHFKDGDIVHRSEEHTSELQSLRHLVCRLLLEKKKQNTHSRIFTTNGTCSLLWITRLNRRAQ